MTLNSAEEIAHEIKKRRRISYPRYRGYRHAQCIVAIEKWRFVPPEGIDSAQIAPFDYRVTFYLERR